MSQNLSSEQIVAEMEAAQKPRKNKAGFMQTTICNGWYKLVSPAGVEYHVSKDDGDWNAWEGDGPWNTGRNFWLGSFRTKAEALAAVHSEG